MEYLWTAWIGALSLGLAIVTVPVVVVFVECTLAWLLRHKVHRANAQAGDPSAAHARGTADERLSKLAVLIPAHNESALIGQTLRILLQQVQPGQRIVVVADNCSDNTAQIARDAGVEVIERTDTVRRGKGYALEAGINYLRSQPPTLVVVVDADTEVATGTLNALGHETLRTGRPTQAIYLLNPPPSAGVKDWIATFAFRVRNLVRPLGQSGLGLPCQLMGTGMALPWDTLSQLTLGSSNLVEDMQLGVDFALAGHPPLYCVTGKVLSDFPDSANAQLTQRQRWEQGHLMTIARQAPRLFSAAFKKFRLDLLGMAMDLSVPPVALLMAILFGLVGLCAITFLVSQLAWPLIWALTLSVLMGIGVFLAWAGFARDIPLSVLMSVPGYILWKLPMYLALSRGKGQSSWVRTERPDQAPVKK